jgi:hypothetical protein
MHARSVRVTDQAEECLVSQDYATRNRTNTSWPTDALERGIVDLYAQRMGTVSKQRAEARQDELDRIVVTQPFGRPFTAQPSYPPDPVDELPGGFAGLRRKLTAATTPARKLATS